jgi:hypothetical protein
VVATLTGLLLHADKAMARMMNETLFMTGYFLYGLLNEWNALLRARFSS